MEPVKKRGRGRPPKSKNKNSINDKKPSSFFKIILPFMLEQNILRIPDVFTRRLNHGLPTLATLSTPTGRAWKVSLCKIKDKLYFTKGWEEFMKHNSISFGFFLTFEYRGHHYFRVHIFDLSCCEIDYEQNTNNQIKAEDPYQLMEEDKLTLNVDNDIFETKCETLSFDVEFRRSNLTGNYMYVPIRFSRECMMKKYVLLEGDDGRTWQLGCSKGKYMVRLIGVGLKNFMNDNNFNIGDKLTFQFKCQKDDHIILKFFKA